MLSEVLARAIMSEHSYSFSQFLPRYLSLATHFRIRSNFRFVGLFAQCTGGERVDYLLPAGHQTVRWSSDMSEMLVSWHRLGRSRAASRFTNIQCLFFLTGDKQSIWKHHGNTTSACRTGNFSIVNASYQVSNVKSSFNCKIDKSHYLFQAFCESICAGFGAQDSTN